MSPASGPDKLRIPYFVVTVLCLVNLAAAVKIIAHAWNGAGWLNDYAHFWLAAGKALNGAAASAYDATAFIADLKLAFDGQVPSLFWVYPPHAFLIHAPFGLLPEFTAYLVFSGLSLLSFLWVTRRVSHYGNYFLFITAMSPAVALTVVFGQNGLWASACLLLLAFGHLNKAPVLGFAAGVLTIKPQLGLMVPLAFLAGRRWSVIGYAIIASIVLIVTSIVLFGLASWQGFFSIFSPDHPINRLVGEGNTAGWQLGTYVVMRASGLGREVAIVGQVLVIILSGVLVWWAHRKGRHGVLTAAMLVTCSYLATPYSGAYDLPALSVVSLLVYLDEAQNDKPSLALMISALLAFSLPFLCFYAQKWHMPVAPQVMLFFAAMLAHRIHRLSQVGLNCNSSR